MFSPKQQRLVEVVQRLALEHKQELDRWKQQSQQLDRPDFLWHFLLQSFATMQSSRGWDGLIGNEDNYSRVTFEALSQLSPTERLQRLEDTLRAAKVRMPQRKARYLNRNYEQLMDMGGLEAAKQQLLSLPGREAKLRFLEQLDGIGPKYARNIMMDVYHGDFRESIAIDQRINKVSEALGLPQGTYEEQEKFYLQVAGQAGVNGWELDRILYNFTSEVLAALASPT